LIINKLHIQKIVLTLAFALSASFFLTYSQNVVNVSSVAALQTAIDNSKAGDIIILANGTYLNNTLNIDKSNITIKAASPGGVFLNGADDINISGNYVTFSGFQFTSGDIGSAYLIEVSGSHNVLTQLNISGYFAKKYIHIQDGSQYNEISYCNIENKPADAIIGCTIQISTSPTIIGYHKISLCTFKNFPGLGGDYGNEPIRIGLSTEMTNVSRTIVEFCYFENVGLGDSESISVKSSENICRYNTFTNNSLAMLVFRHGYRNIAYGNFFIKGSGGIRIKEGDTHFVYNNYFETGAADAITLQFVPEFPLKDINIVHNTFVNCGTVDLGGAGPTNCTLANNIFKKTSGSIFSNANGATSFAGNIYSGTPGISISSGMKNIDPKLVINSDGYYGISSASPAIDASSAAYPAILDIAGINDDPALLLDISGQSRATAATLKDVGCDEFTTGTTINHPLKLSEVGPSYLGGPDGSIPNSVLPPSSYFDLSAWKLQTLDPVYNFIEKNSAELMAGYTSSFFFTSPTDSSMVFKVPSNGETTSVNTIYPRVELRQTSNGANWKLSDTNEHYLSAKCKVIMVAIAKPQTIIGQIHGSETNSELLKLRWTGYLAGQCKIEARFEINDATQSEYGVTLATGLSLGDMISYSIAMKNGTITVSVNGVSASQTYTSEFFGSTDAYYFKAGNYLQYSSTDPAIAGQNQFYKLTLAKQSQAITFNSLTEHFPDETDFIPGASASSGLPVLYSSSNTDVAVITNGKIHIKAAGSTEITASQPGNIDFNAASDVARTLNIIKRQQVIEFAEMPSKVFGNEDFIVYATSNSGLPVSLQSSNTDVATIDGDTIRIAGAGTSVITASQSGNAIYFAAPDVSRTFTVLKLDQSITFDALPDRLISDPDFSLLATASSGLPVSFASSDPTVASISGNNIHIEGAGTTVITASQAGNSNYSEALSIAQTLTVNLADFVLSPDKNDFDLSIFPNPVSRIGTITYKLQSKTEVSLAIFDITGRKLKTIYFREDQNTCQVDFSKFENGVYFIKYTIGTTSGVIKFIVKNGL
jgi:hypothetical protein